MKFVHGIIRITLTILLLVAIWRSAVWTVALALTFLAIFAEITASTISINERRLQALEKAQWIHFPAGNRATTTEQLARWKDELNRAGGKR